MSGRRKSRSSDEPLLPRKKKNRLNIGAVRVVATGEMSFIPHLLISYLSNLFTPDLPYLLFLLKEPILEAVDARQVKL